MRQSRPRDPGSVRSSIKMPDIASVSNSVGPLHSTPGVGREGIERPASPETPVDRLGRQDRVEVSRHAEWFQALREMPDIRQDRVEAIQKAIQEDAYVTPEKIDVAIEGLLQDVRA